MDKGKSKIQKFYYYCFHCYIEIDFAKFNEF